MCVQNSEKIEPPRKVKTVKVGHQECVVETLREWVNSRMASIRKAVRFERDYATDERMANLNGRLAELSIIREKVNDGRIQEIG